MSRSLQLGVHARAGAARADRRLGLAQHAHWRSARRRLRAAPESVAGDFGFSAFFLAESGQPAVSNVLMLSLRSCQLDHRFAGPHRLRFGAKRRCLSSCFARARAQLRPSVVPWTDMVFSEIAAELLKKGFTNPAD
eukprot:6090997-Pleurochrysis_carterae.AAC.1